MTQLEPTEHDDKFGDRYDHPSFGTIGFSRTQGPASPLFGSSILHKNTILLEVHTAHLWRTLHSDRVHEDDLIVRAEMSATQFADAVTSMNAGGVPITLRFVAGKGQIKGDTPFQSKVRQFNEEFQGQIDSLGMEFDKVIALANETKAQKRLVRALELLKQGFRSNTPYIAECFSEQMERTLVEAKGELEAAVSNVVRNYGVEAIRAQAPVLIEGQAKGPEHV